MPDQRERADWSLARRVLLGGGLVVITCVGLIGLSVDRAFENSVEELVQERLLARVYMLMGATSITDDGRLELPAQLPEERLATPGSGAYAAITDEDGTLLWRSASSVGQNVSYPGPAERGLPQLNKARDSSGTLLQGLSYPVYWELPSGKDRLLSFQVAESRTLVESQTVAFRRTLTWWLAAGAASLLVVMAGVLLWSLAPVRSIAKEVRLVEAGELDGFNQQYPVELRPLTDSLNALISSREKRIQRYRHALSDLAHSLKTPLAVLRAGGNDSSSAPPGTNAQLQRMEETIEYHLQRAAITGRMPLAAPVAVAPAALAIVDSLKKIYAEKQLTFITEIDSQVRFPGAAGDLSELLGNLADNACKWANSRVRLRAVNDASQHSGFRLDIDDDGPGIPAEMRQQVISRGVRADSENPGQGIGLAVVVETVTEMYQGTVAIDTSDLGGTRITVSIPANG